MSGSEPNESTQRHAGETVPYTADYKTVCCSRVHHFHKGQRFPECDEHGETEWSWIPPFDGVQHYHFDLSDKIHLSHSAGVAIGDGVIVTGDKNIAVVEGHVVDTNVRIEDQPDKQIISQDQAFERIAAAFRLNLSLLERNIQQARTESNQFFKLTLVFASIGFVVVVVAIIILLFGAVTAGIVTAISGLVQEITAALFFNKDRELRKTIHSMTNQILEFHKILTMVDVATTIDNQEERDHMKQTIILNVLGISEKTRDNEA